jgi:transposase InsO family protein
MANGTRFAMAAALPLRQDFTAADLRLQARRTGDASQVRRLLALACIYEGGSRSEAATTGGVTLQVVRDWVIRFNTLGSGGPRTNGKAERFIQTALRKWLYAKPYRQSNQRADDMPSWTPWYNHHRPHSALKAQAPASRLNNLLGNDS